MTRSAQHNGTSHPMAHLAAKEKARLSAILADIRARDRLDGPARHLRLVRTFRDDFADFIADIRANPSLALVCAGGGAVLGLSATVGLAFVWSLFL